MNTLFISDLHLDPRHPEIFSIFSRFLKTQVIQSDALYILGDLFETWIGDDHDTAFNRGVISALKAVTDHGVPVYFMPGNRDFLIGDAFLKATGVTLLEDPCVVSVYGKRLLLSHGDALCLADSAYQDFRRRVRTPRWQARMLAKPLWLRQCFARIGRWISRLYTRQANPSIMDVTPSAVIALMDRFDVDTLIHGHTHRLAEHVVDRHGQVAKRFVLGAWHDCGNSLLCAPDHNLCFIQDLA